MDAQTIKEIFSHIRDVDTEIKSIERNRGDKADVPLIVVDNGRKIIPAEMIIADFEKTQPAPFRRKGQHTAASVQSLLDWMLKHAPDDAPVFAAGSEKLMGAWRVPKLSLIGIANYSTGPNAPAWHDHKVRYDFPISPQWQIWASKHSEDDKVIWFSQEDFAEFIEQRIHDLSSINSKDTLSEAVTRFIEATGKKAGELTAAPSQMWKLSRDLKIYSQEKIETKIDLASGQAKLQYSQEHTGAGGQPVKIPEIFFLRIPVFFGQDPVLIGVKLRYRTAAQSVMWAYSLFAPDLVVADEFEAAVEYVRGASRTVYLGEPE